MVTHGHVQNGVVVLDKGVSLPEGQKVTGNVVEPIPPSERRYYVSPDRRKAILGLIGIWKTENPPSDEEVDQIRYEAIMKKHG